MNERGDIVRVYTNSLNATRSNSHGFLLTEGRYEAIDFPGAAYTTVLGINDDGEIVGQFTNRSGVAHGFKAVPIG
jgi:probable HAF family extracellular repeat protein